MIRTARLVPAALPAKIKDITGQKIGRLTVIEFAGFLSNGKHREQAWRCACASCGGSTVARASNLLGGRTKSCGCSTRSHGRAGTPEYVAWQSMRRRCATPSTTSFEHYGGRNIRVCARWRKFENFYADMGKRPSPQHSLDRINNNGPYSPKNCRWADRKTQARNRRDNRLLTHRGETLCLTDWCERLRVNRELVGGRLRRGWSIEDALTRPPQPGRPHPARLAA